METIYYHMTKSIKQRTQRKEFRRIALIKSIRAVTGLDLMIEATRYLSIYDKWIESEGRINALKRAKAIHHTVLNCILEQPSTNYPFLATKKGWPRACYGLRKYAKTIKGMQAVLSLTGFVRGEYAPGSPDFSTIEKPGVKLAAPLLKEISKQAKAWEEKLFFEEPTIRYRGKNGPNGPAALTSINEAKALFLDHKPYFEKLMTFSKKIYEEETVSKIRKIIIETARLPAIINPSRRRLRALAIKREFGGKDRVFAMADFWTQTMLQPLHEGLDSILRTIPQDGTFGQDQTAERVRSLTATSKPLYSLDLTAATDRMPISLQTKVLGIILDDQRAATIWRDIMVSLPFSYKGSNYYYAVGQGMGTYTSWPIMALTHHCIVRTAFARCKDESYDYAILGDDVVIAGDGPAREYLSILKELGMEISLTKSVIGVNRAEIAKRIFISGHEITPLPVRLINRMNRAEPALFMQLADWWKTRSGDSLAQSVLDGSLESLAKSLFGKNADDALSLITSPIVYERFGIWSDRLHPLPDTAPEDVLECYSKYVRDHFFNRTVEAMNQAVVDAMNEIAFFQSKVNNLLEKEGFQTEPSSPMGITVLDVILTQFPQTVETVQGNTIIPLRISSFSHKNPFREEVVRKTTNSLIRFSREWRAGLHLQKFEKFCKRVASIKSNRSAKQTD